MKLNNVEFKAVDELIPYARNARLHSDQQVAQIAASIREFGFCNPVLIDEQDGIIAGHGRVLAARKLQLTEVPCLRLSHLTPTQRKAYILADNKLALNADWDMEMLALEIAELQELEFDVGLTGFGEEEIAGLGLDMAEPAIPESSAQEINPDDYRMGHCCPRCGFEFDDDKA